jgi:dTDP-4-amino-4,6-dideoxygalactose transaminase
VRVPFLELADAHADLSAPLEEAVARVLRSGWYIGGPEVDAFEQAFAAATGASHCVGVANGYDALHLILRALEIGPGDEVILASNSYLATVLAVTAVGARPVLVEPDPATFNLDPVRVAAAITDRTRALLPTHLYGQPADLDALLGIARQHGLKLVEDAAQAHGARYRGHPVGAHGDAVAWSFYPTKNLGAAGDAGAVTTNRADLAERIRVLGNYGSRQRYISDLKGVNSRLDPLQAAILQVKLGKLAEWNARRAEISRTYRERLAGLPITLPYVPEWAEPAWHLFVVQFERRDWLSEGLAAEGVQTLVHYPVPPHRQGAYADLGYPGGSFPIAEAMADQVLSLPIGPHMTDEQVDIVCRALHTLLG